MTNNSWPGQQYDNPYPTANLPSSADHSGYTPRSDPPPYYTNHGPVGPGPGRPPPRWPLVVVAVVVMAASLTAAAVAIATTSSSQVPPGEASPPATAPGVVAPALEKPAGLDSGQSVFFDKMQSDLQLAVERLDRGEDPTSRCISVLVTAEGFADGFESAAEKATEHCGREIPIAWAAHQLDAAAAEGDPFDAIMGCARAKVALDSIEDRFADPRVGELRTRSEQVCR